MNRHYCQFPICLLALNVGIDGQLLHILGYSITEYGKTLWPKYTPEEREQLRAHPPEWCTVSLKEDEHVQAVIACEELGLIPDHVYTVTAHHGAARRYIDIIEQIHGPYPLVRIDVDWVLQAFHETGISYDELVVLVAIYSKIGDKEGPVRITQDEIWRRGLGCKSKDVFRTLNPYYKKFLTQRRVRSVIERLAERNFFARITYGRRHTYYSHRLTQEELEDEVFKSKTYRARARQARIARDTELTRRIQAERRKRAGGDATEGATGTPP